MIKPTVGRVVWFWPMGENLPAVLDRSQPLQASIAFVNSDRLINIGGVDHEGRPYSRVGVTLVQEGDERPSYPHATWMPFQIGQARAQAAKTD